jgi:hypothetical protein
MSASVSTNTTSSGSGVGSSKSVVTSTPPRNTNAGVGGGGVVPLKTSAPTPQTTNRPKATATTVTPKNNVKNNTATSVAQSTNRSHKVFDFVDLQQPSSPSNVELQPPNAIERILTNETSSYIDVAKVCLQLCSVSISGIAMNTDVNYFRNGCSIHSKLSIPISHTGGNDVHGDDTSNSDHSTILRQVRFLCICLQHHTDRQCRIIAAQTIASLARNVYAQIRPSPLLYGHYEALSHQYEDEVGSDIATTLCSVALDAVDDGVSAACMAALGHLIQTGSTSTYGGLFDDALAVHVRHLQVGTSPYAPVLRSISDEDIGLALQELAVRVIENCLAPRLLQLLDRVIRFNNTRHINVALPFLSVSLVHLVGVYPTALHHTDRTVYSKRWSELDVSGLVDACVTSLILPILQRPSSSSSTIVAITAAVAGLRLVHALPERSWVKPVCRWAVTVIQEEYNSTCIGGSRGGMAIESRLALLSVLVVASRALPVYPDRTRTLIWIATHLTSPTLPSTASTPVCCAGLRLNLPDRTIHTNTETVVYRRPTRMALWTEIALSFFLDGPSSQPQHSRGDGLRTFLSSPVLSRIVGSTSSVTTADMTHQEQLLRDEMLLAFASVAIEAGRLLRVSADGNTPLATLDPTCETTTEWLALVAIVLSSFSDCALLPVVGSSAVYLDETLSVLTAGLAAYIQLLQEYLHVVGLLHPSTSVALKLGANACPPHLLWDRLTESATFLSRLEPTVLESQVNSADNIKTSTKLLDALVSREIKQGIPSHHMRLFILSLASDHWVQCRIGAIRKQHVESITGSMSPTNDTLNVTSGREILMSLAPKRLLAKILQAHVPPVSNDGKPRRDPIKKLALESTRVSVACIENIALIACDWRRRFGSSSESKHLVSIAVGLLQGKMDETPIDDTMKLIMGPTCDAAVSRIQSFYESSGPVGPSMDSFPLSELVMQPVKIKIKPLVSASKPNPRPRDDVMREYLMQLCRQIVASRIQLSTLSFPPAAGSLFSAARPFNWLRLSVPPILPSRDGRIYGCRGATMSAWDHSVKASSSASDPIQLIVAYTIRRHLRYDGEDDYRLTAIVRAFNMTPIDIAEGLRLELGIVKNPNESGDEHDSATLAHVEALGFNVEDLQSDMSLSYVAVECRQEIKSGEYITWEVTLDDIAVSNSLNLVPSVVYLNVPVEPEDTGVKWVGEKSSVGENSAVNRDTKNGEDDFQVTSSDVGTANAFQGGTSNVRLIGEPLPLPPLVVCRPCPLVFFTDRCGDIDSFRFLWFRFPYHLAPLKLISPTSLPGIHNIHPVTRKIGEMSSLTWEGEAIPGGVATKLWAFMSLSGFRIFCVLSESDSPNSPIPLKTLYIRGDDQSLLFTLIGSKESRDSVVSSLLPDMLPDA